MPTTKQLSYYAAAFAVAGGALRPFFASAFVSEVPSRRPGTAAPRQAGGCCVAFGGPSTSARKSTSNDKNNNENDDEDDNYNWTSDFDGYNIGGDDDDAVTGASPAPGGGGVEERGRGRRKDSGSDDSAVVQQGRGGEEEEEEESYTFSQLFRQTSEDLTASQTRVFSLGQDIILSDFVGNLGFEEVTDWEYYYQNEDDPIDRKVVPPNPFDSSQPRRTRQQSGSVIRIFRGECVGQLGGTLRAQGMDNRVLVKEYSGPLALRLAQAEREVLAKLQSSIVERDGGEESWITPAASRSSNPDGKMMRKDNANVAKLLSKLSTGAPYVGMLGQISVQDVLQEVDANEFYRALSVPPPKPAAMWVVYEYAGLNSLQAYTSEPPATRRAKVPPKRGFFGPVEPPPLPTFAERAKYVKAIMKQTLQAVATLHEAGIVRVFSRGRMDGLLLPVLCACVCSYFFELYSIICSYCQRKTGSPEYRT